MKSEVELPIEFLGSGNPSHPCCRDVLKFVNEVYVDNKKEGQECEVVCLVSVKVCTY